MTRYEKKTRAEIIHGAQRLLIHGRVTRLHDDNGYTAVSENHIVHKEKIEDVVIWQTL